MKKFLSILVSTVIAVSAVSFSASAEENTKVQYLTQEEIHVGNTLVTDKNKDNILGDTNVSAKFDSQNNVLTINNLTINENNLYSEKGLYNSVDNYGIKLSNYKSDSSETNPITLKILGNNTIDLSNAANSTTCYAVSHLGKLTIIGDGTLTIKLPKKSVVDLGIFSQNGIVIKEAKINIECTGEFYDFYGLLGANVTLEENTDVKIVFGEPIKIDTHFYGYAIGINGLKFSINGGNLLIKTNSNFGEIIEKRNAMLSLVPHDYSDKLYTEPHIVKYSYDCDGKDAIETTSLSKIPALDKFRYLEIKKIIKIDSPAIDNNEPVVGDTLTASINPTDAKVSYLWKADGKEIDNATDKTFKVTENELGKKISVTVTGKENYTGTLTSKETSPVKKLIDGVNIDNMQPKCGDILKATFTPKDGTVTFAWFADAKQIEGATGETYTVTPSDIGKSISVKVTGTGNYKGTVISNETQPVCPALLAGNGQQFYKGEAPEGGIVLTFTGGLSEISHVNINEQEINKNDYTVDPVKNTLTLKKSYLDTLDINTYDVGMCFDFDADINAKFTVLKKPADTPIVPDTPDKPDTPVTPTDTNVTNPKTGTSDASFPTGGFVALLLGIVGIVFAKKVFPVKGM